MKKNRLLTDTLRSVSRSFYFTLRVLPENLREPIAIAYLLARAADTIADTEAVVVEKRLYYLRLFRDQVLDAPDEKVLREVTDNLRCRQIKSEERYLLESLYQICMLLYGLWPDDRQRVKKVVGVLIQGMEIDLTSFVANEGERGGIKSFGTPFELDNYIYYVAGCVGEFWTEVAMAHETSLQNWNKNHYKKLGVNFGKALQLTNILRDFPNDLRIGRCYLPETELVTYGIEVEQLLKSDNSAVARPLLRAWLEKTADYYSDAEEYFMAIPRRCFRLRLSVLWPILIGLATLAEISKNEQWLDPELPSKVTRRWLYGMMFCSIAFSGSNRLTGMWIRRLRKGIDLE